VQRIAGLRVVPGLCVAATHEVQSVILVARRPFAQVRSVALDENSRTSATLVRIILRDLHGISPATTVGPPEVERMLETSDAALLIGDPALTVDRSRYEVLDLAGEWRRLTGKPFVFAVWAVAPEVDAEGLTEALLGSLGAGLEQLDRVIDRAVAELGLDHAVAERYLLRQLRFAMGLEELAGLEEFYRRAHTIGAIGPPAPVRFL
jgi:chorismate dehydratase